MINSFKNIIAKNDQLGNTFKISEDSFNKMKRKPENHFLVKLGYDNPTDVLDCWYVNESERLKAIQTQQTFCDYATSEYFKISNRIDSTFIEGYLGNKDEKLTYFDNYINVYSYFRDLQNRQKIYFTFDRVSLFQVVEIVPEKPLRFILKRIDNQKAFKRNQIFMIMPFHNDDIGKFYFDIIRPFIKDDLKINIYRADDFKDNDIIVQTIYTLLEESEIIIADTTHENKNVFYEIGYASAIGKEIIIIQNKTTEQKLFFDRAHIRAIMYDPDDTETFKFDLKSTIESIRDRQ